MKYEIYPPVKILRDEINKRRLTYESIAGLSGMSVGHLKNILTGRVDMTMRDRDTLCRTLDIYPGEVVMQREDLTDSKGFIDIRKMPEALQDAIRLITDALNNHPPSSPSDEDATKT